MNIRHPVLLVILVIIGVGMINSLFQDPPQPSDPQVVAKEVEEKRQYNDAHCKSKGLIYVENISSKGECVTQEELVKITLENSKRLKEIQKSRANEGLK
jgi:hypothetical protein